jgi:acylphosphatase
MGERTLMDFGRPRMAGNSNQAIMETMETQRLHVLIHGWVQGVGFRYSARAKAQALGLTGWVRNLHDGGVEAEFDGPKPDLELMLAWCNHGPAGASVTKVDATWETSPNQHASFNIRH